MTRRARRNEWAALDTLVSMEGLLHATQYLNGVYGVRTAAVAGCEHPSILDTARRLRAANVTDCVLIGNRQATLRIADESGLDISAFEIVDRPDDLSVAEAAVGMAGSGGADYLMKGMVPTPVLMGTAMNRELGFRLDRLMSHITMFDHPGYDRLLMVSDSGLNIAPNINEKMTIIENAIAVAHAIGVARPHVALLAPTEKVNIKVEPAVDDALLTQMGNRGQIRGARLDGPVALDIAVSAQAAADKGMFSPVAGKTDIFIVSDLDSGNLFYKMLNWFTPAKVAGFIVGGKTPVVLASRADLAPTKFYSSLVCAFLSHTLKFEPS